MSHVNHILKNSYTYTYNQYGKIHSYEHDFLVEIFFYNLFLNNSHCAEIMALEDVNGVYNTIT